MLQKRSLILQNIVLNLSNMCFSTLIPKPKHGPTHPNRTNLKNDKKTSCYDTGITEKDIDYKHHIGF